MSAVAIDVEGLSKSFGGQRVVKDLSIQVQEGRITGFLGPNGSGKTTTLRMLCGLLTPDGGRGTALGLDIVADAAEVKRQTGYMTQRFSLYEDLTVEENLQFAARIHSLDCRRERVGAALDDLGLAVALRQEVEELRGDGWLVEYEEQLGEERLPATVEISLYRIGQEALTNARKHAQTEWIRLELGRREGMASLEVRDWGCGFDPEASNGEIGPGERVGLSGMRERASLFGGEFEVRSRAGEGTSVTARLPLPGPAEDREEERDQR